MWKIAFHNNKFRMNFIAINSQIESFHQLPIIPQIVNNNQFTWQWIVPKKKKKKQNCLKKKTMNKLKPNEKRRNKLKSKWHDYLTTLSRAIKVHFRFQWNWKLWFGETWIVFILLFGKQSVNLNNLNRIHIHIFSQREPYKYSNVTYLAVSSCNSLLQTRCE